MTTFRELARVIELGSDDYNSRKHMKRIRRVMKKYKVLREPTPEGAVAALQELGPTFVKIGQIASNRGDLLPTEYVKAFETLRANVTPMPFEQVQKRINESLGVPWQEVFTELDDKPLGSASIAQVHRAVLKNGNVVAVKVRRPGIVNQMAEDIVLMYKLVAIAEFLTPANQLLKSAQGLIDELKRTTREELNFAVELNNLMRFHASMEHEKGVTCPVAYPEYSTEEVLVMEYIEGTSAGSAAKLTEQGYDPLAIGEVLANNYVTQVIDNGFFHADPHPGNIIIRDNEAVWIDLGMTGKLNASERIMIGKMFLAIASNDAYALKEVLLSFSPVDKNINHGALLGELESLVAKYGTISASDLDIGQALMDIVSLFKTYNIALPAALTMLARGFITIEGVITELNPGICFVDVLSKHVEHNELTLESAKEKTKEILTASVSSARAAARLPRQAGNTLDMVQKGQLKMNMDLHMSDNMLATTYSLVGNICLSVIAAALFVGSAMLCNTDMGGPELLEVPALAMFGFAGSAILSVYVIIKTIQVRHQIRNDLKIK